MNQDWSASHSNAYPHAPRRSKDLELAELHYGTEKKQNILHDSETIVKYRKTYLERRLSNLNPDEPPIQPEAFLDESYYHLDHHARRAYYVPDIVVNQTGHKPMLVIFGAFTVYKENNGPRAELVEENTTIWPVKGKAQCPRRRECRYEARIDCTSSFLQCIRLTSLWKKTVIQCKYYYGEHQPNAVHSVAVVE